MNSLIHFIKNYPDASFGKGSNEAEINVAEETLGLKFSVEYKEYLREVSSASFDGRELTGLCKSQRLDVVPVTQKQRKLNLDIPESLYVIEETNIDGIVIWQDYSGVVYRSSPGVKPTKIAYSVEKYLNL